VNEASKPSIDGASVEMLVRLRAISDPELVAAFLAGEREAFDVIVERHRRQVYQLCYRFLGNHEDASDLTQDVFVRAFKGAAQFQGRRAVGHVAVSRGRQHLPESPGAQAATARDHRT
jgi:hypothetical protein